MSQQAARRFSLAMMAALLAGCASAPAPRPVTPAPLPPPSAPQVDAQRRSEFDRSLDHWHGARTQELFAKLGAPKSSTRGRDGTVVHLYAKSAQLKGPTGPVMFSCVVRYIVNERSDRIIDHRIEGC
nr:hypothetical protein [uncultured Roseateles sp.]